ncbi:MAG TPA: hypothetical protein P5294_02830 [Smithellaceae bacterium]|nr:hypothetical protein [Smithellaceae bacterium]HRS88077.1 hypothetical protein [Smithellaceae bacterium]HRV25448.1 hypothetical protein [Smithellaceae bacterium]
MTSDQREALSGLFAQKKLHWLSVVAFAAAILAIYNLITLDLKEFSFYLVLGFVLFFGNFLVDRRKAFNNYKKTVSEEEYEAFMEHNKLIRFDYLFYKYGNTIIGALIIVGIIILFFNWRIGLTITFFSFCIITPLKVYLISKMMIRKMIIRFAFYIVLMAIIWIIYPPK